jgi:antitoxin ParD1/3/4
MSMHVNFPEAMENYIKEKVSGGFYGNATEVIRDAVRRMQDEERRKAAFMAAVAVGEAQLDRGESEEYTPELAEKILKDATGALHIDKEIKPDVLP